MSVIKHMKKMPDDDNAGCEEDGHDDDGDDADDDDNLTYDEAVDGGDSV